MAVAIKRVIKFSYAKMNSVQSEQTRIRAKNKYKNDHICEEFKKFNLHPINNTEGLTYNQYFKKYCKRRTGGKKKVDVVSEMGEKDFYLDKLYTGKGGGKTTCCVESMVISLNDRIDATEEAIKAYQEDPDNQQKMDAFVTYITKSDPRFRNCRFLNVDWHFDEVYTPYEIPIYEDANRSDAIFIIHVFSSSVISALRPRPGASNKAFSTPPSLNLFKHNITLHLLMPTLSAISLIETPSARNNSILALHTVCACIVLARVCNSRYERCSSVSVIVFTFLPMNMTSLYNYMKIISWNTY